MAQPGELDDAIDFKPFFDMIVGILFVLLILVAAQMFFTQWGASEERTPQEKAQQVRLEWEREITAFLTDAAERLRARGLHPTIDQVDRTLAVPLADVTTVEDAGRRADATRMAKLGQALADALSCVPGGSLMQDCPHFDRLRLGQFRSETRLVDLSPVAQLAPERYVNLLSAVLNAALIESTPRLLSITGSTGGPALQPAGGIFVAPSTEEHAARRPLRGDFTLRFGFDRPPEIGP